MLQFGEFMHKINFWSQWFSTQRYLLPRQTTWSLKSTVEGQNRNLQSVFVWEPAPLNPQWKHRIDSYNTSSDLKQQLCQEHCPISTSLTVTQKNKLLKKVRNICKPDSTKEHIIIFLKVFVLVYLFIYSFMSRKYLRKKELSAEAWIQQPFQYHPAMCTLLPKNFVCPPGRNAKMFSIPLRMQLSK